MRLFSFILLLLVSSLYFLVPASCQFGCFNPPETCGPQPCGPDNCQGNCDQGYCCTMGALVANGDSGCHEVADCESDSSKCAGTCWAGRCCEASGPSALKLRAAQSGCNIPVGCSSVCSAANCQGNCDQGKCCVMGAQLQ